MPMLPDDKTFEEVAGLTQKLELLSRESELFYAIYKSLYIALRVVTSGDPELIHVFNSMLDQFVKEDLDLDNQDIQ